jgi:hypothetical protein
MKFPHYAARAAAVGAALAAAGLLGACGSDQRTPPRDLAALDACRQRADEVFQKQNRGDVYRSDVFATSGRDAPYATNTLPGLTTRGLSGEYERENMVDDCLNATTTARPAAAQPAGGASPSFSPPTSLPSQ